MQEYIITYITPRERVKHIRVFADGVDGLAETLTNQIFTGEAQRNKYIITTIWQLNTFYKVFESVADFIKDRPNLENLFKIPDVMTVKHYTENNGIMIHNFASLLQSFKKTYEDENKEIKTYVQKADYLKCIM